MNVCQLSRNQAGASHQFENRKTEVSKMFVKNGKLMLLAMAGSSSIALLLIGGKVKSDSIGDAGSDAKSLSLNKMVVGSLGLSSIVALRSLCSLSLLGSLRFELGVDEGRGASSEIRVEPEKLFHTAVLSYCLQVKASYPN